MKLSLDALLIIPLCWGHFQENRKENVEKEGLEKTKCSDHLVNSFGWKYTSNNFSPAFLDKAFWSFVFNCRYFKICLHFERWKKMEAVKQQKKELWSLNKSISFEAWSLKIHSFWCFCFTNTSSRSIKFTFKVSSAHAPRRKKRVGALSSLN